MSVTQASRFFAVLSLVALGGGVALWAGWLARARWVQQLRQVALPLGLAVAGTAVAGSLYYSEVVGFTPCRLCWYQRIGIYPLVVLLAVAIVRRRDDVRAYVWPLAAIVAPISIYHWTIQTWPSLEGSACDLTAPCSVRWVEQFGIVSIPFMALSTVIAVSALAAVAGAPRRDRTAPRSPTNLTEEVDA